PRKPPTSPPLPRPRSKPLKPPPNSSSSPAVSSPRQGLPWDNRKVTDFENAFRNLLILPFVRTTTQRFLHLVAPKPYPEFEIRMPKYKTSETQQSLRTAFLSSPDTRPSPFCHRTAYTTLFP